MYRNLQNELALVSSNITNLISTDNFPERVRPSCLASAVRSYPVRGGKRLRPALLLWANGVLGGNPDQALYAGCAVELFHTWTLVHDDIIDEEDSVESVNTFNKMLSRWAVAFFALRSYLNKKSLYKNGNQNNM